MKVKSSWNKIYSFLKMVKRSYPRFMYILVIGGITGASIPFLSLFFSAQILNNLIDGQYTMAMISVWWLLITTLIAGFISKACSQRVLLMKENSDNVIQEQLASKAFVLEYEKFEKQETMDALRRANLSSRGMGGIGDHIHDIYRLIENACSILYSFIFVVLLFSQVDDVGKRNFFTSYASTLVLILIYIGLIFVYSIGSKKVIEIFNNMSKLNDHINSSYGYMDDLIMNQKNAKDIRIYQLQDTLNDKMIELEKQGLHGYFIAGIESGKNYAMNSFISQIAAGSGYVLIGAKALYGVIPIGNVLLYAGAINRIVSSFMQFMPILNQVIYRSTFLDAFTQFINQPNMSYDGTLPIEKREDGHYSFAFHDVSFSYPDTNVEVLSHVTMEFQLGQKVAIVGMNGAGKTTLIKLLCRLYEPTGGYITLNGIDIRKYSYQEYVNVFSVVFQDFHLFSLPLDENVASGEQVDKDELRAALQQVDLKERVEKMKDGVRSQLYNNNGEGTDVSGGEAQRLAIARALYKDAPFVILDEPTAALDPIAEAEIYENFNALIANKTAIYISHRMSSCKFCDSIVVLDHGKIAETGTHEELVELGGIYAKLYETQAQYYA